MNTSCEIRTDLLGVGVEARKDGWGGSRDQLARLQRPRVDFISNNVLSNGLGKSPPPENCRLTVFYH